MLIYKKFWLVFLCVCICTATIFAFEKEFDFTAGHNQNKRLLLSYTYTLKADESDAQEVQAENNFTEKKLPSYQIMLIIKTEIQEHTYEVQLQEGQHELFWYQHLIGNIKSVYMIFDDEIYDYADFSIALKMTSIQKEQANNHQVITASLEDMLSWKPLDEQEEDDFYVFRWQSYPDVLIFAFEDRIVQAKYLKRIAFFTEKTHTRGTIQYLPDISHRQGWGAHDYKISDMVEFYNEVAKKQLDDYLSRPLLNKEEIYLQDMLMHLNIVNVKDDKVEERGVEYGIGDGYHDGAVVSYARSDRKALQKTLLFHELLHTVFFRDESVRNKLDEVWDGLPPKHKKIWKAFMEKNGYDPSFDYLMENELFAYLLQRPVDDLSWYIPARILAEALPRIKGEKFTETDTQEFIKILTDAAYELSDYLQVHYYLYDGNMQYVREVQ